MQAKQSFTFFLQLTCPQLAGFCGSDFWERLILQAAYHEPAVRYAVTAVGSPHQLTEYQVSLDDAKKGFALEQYNLAIRELVNSVSGNGRQRVDVCLINCILLTCFEVVVINSYRHVRDTDVYRTYKVIMSQQDDISEVVREIMKQKHHEPIVRAYANFYAPLDVIARIFSGLDLQVAAVSALLTICSLLKVR